MAAPTADVFDRLRLFAAIDDLPSRPTQTIFETFTGADLATVPIGTADDVEIAFVKARIAQTEWARRSVRSRAAIISRYRSLVLARRDELMDMIQAETGKSRASAQEEVCEILITARHYAKQAPDLLAPQQVAALIPGMIKTVVHHQPKDVVGMIAPWNYPMALPIGDAIPALLAGNAVVLKPDSRTPFTVLANIALLREAGLPRDLFAVIPGPGSVVGTAIADACDYLMFTGSTATGRVLAQRCGQRLIGFSAELGGKNPMIITAGADLDTAAKAAVRACFSNAGQMCISIERIYVEQSVADEFIALFATYTAGITLGASYDFDTYMGSLISADQVATVAKHVDDALTKGATLVAGGKPRPDLGPTFFEPTILTGVTEEMECCRNETFGPVVSVYPVADVEEAIEKANDSEYGLNASVWAASKSAGEAIAVRLRTGTVNVDEGYAPAWGSASAPMGGMKASGVGRRHGTQGLLTYTEPQTVATTRILSLDPPFGIPPVLWQKAFVPLVDAIGWLPGR